MISCKASSRLDFLVTDEGDLKEFELSVVAGFEAGVCCEVMGISESISWLKGKDGSSLIKASLYRVQIFLLLFFVFLFEYV